ncbi:MAG TPA: TMEM143 family protein, partial [Pseudomonadales bacterium]|nr:TMEM143 family protein [Pseudomonadales bacterium]
RPPLRFIPFRKKDIVEMCVASGGLSGGDQMKFREFCHLLESIFHFEYHQRLEAIKDSYAPLNPDRDTRKVGVFTEGKEDDFVGQLEDLLDKANYERLADEELQVAFRESSLFQLNLKVDFNDFDEALLFVRGESVRTEEVKKFYGLVKRPIEFSNFDRVVIYIRFAELTGHGERIYKPGTTMLKMFQNVPKADMEMLFPNTRLGMRLVDKIVIGVPAIIGGGIILTTKLGTSLILLGALVGFYLGLHSSPVEMNQAALIGLVAGLGGLGSFVWKQFVNFKNRKLTFMQTLTESLYFKNLDNNAGVFHRLIDDAEEEECKEAILAYYFLLTQTGIANAAQLDQSVEQWFSGRWRSALNFEVEDALGKLVNLGLVIDDGEHLTIPGLETACGILDKRWDEYFSYSVARQMEDGAGS